MVRLDTTLLCALPLSATAFSTVRQHQSIRRPGSLTLSLSSNNPQGLLVEEELTPDAPNASPILGQDLVEAVIGNSADIGEDIFLVNLENTSPELVLSEEPNDETVVVVSKGAESTPDVSLPSDVPPTIFTYTQSNATETAVSGLGDQITQQQQQQGITENVEAVLAASEDAMILAEAALPEEVKEELGSFGSNGTENGSPITTPLEDLVEIVPAEEVVGEPETTEIAAPSAGKILKFAIPAIGVWLASPMLSLIDTSAVGVLSGTIEQAALNPAVAVTDYAALLIAFLYTAATNLVATAEEADRTVPGKPKTAGAMLGAMQLSTYVGLGLGAALFVFARPLLRAIIGNDAINPAVFAAAMKYVRIRALGMPAAAIIGSAQAGSLGFKDTRTPLKVLLAAAVVNFFGDMCFVGCKHNLIGGAAGAAWATVFSQYAALAMFVRWLSKKPKAGKSGPKVVDLTKNIMDFMKPSKKGGKKANKLQEVLESNEVDLKQKEAAEGVAPSKRKGLFGKVRSWKRSKAASTDDVETKEAAPSVAGLLAGRLSPIDLLKLPPKDVAKEFKPYVLPVTVTQIGRVSGYVAMSHVVSSSLGTISMAAQQVIVSFFYCLTPIADSLSLTAQSFLPGICQRKPSQERSDALRKTGINFMKAGGVFGAAMAAMIGLLPIMSGFFTSDPMVVSLVNSVVPLLVAFFVVHGFLQAAEGLLLGQKDLGYLGKMYGAYFFAVPYFMMRVKRAALSGVKGVNLGSVWTVFLGYQMFRLLAWVSRVGIIQRRTDRETAKLGEAL